MSGEHPVVAVLGGGQLGWMLGLAGLPLGVRCRFLDPVPSAPASAVGPLVVGALGDERALAEVADGADLVTYEWEGVPAEAAHSLEPRVPVRPGPRPLAVSQDRLAEKETFARLGIGVPGFAAVGDRAVTRRRSRAPGCARGAEDAARWLRRQGPVRASVRRRRRRRVRRARRRRR